MLRVVARLDRNIFEPIVLLPVEGPLVGMLNQAGIQVHIFPALKIITRSVFKSPRFLLWLAGFIPSAVQLACLMRRLRIDIVHTNTGVICSSAIAAWLARAPHICHIREWFQEFSFLWKPYSFYILHFSDRVICVSGAIAAQFVPSSKIEVVHDGFDSSEFNPLSEEEKSRSRLNFGFHPAEWIVGTVGRVKFVRKGQEVLLEALGILKNQGVEMRCLIAGGSPPGAEEQLPLMKALAVKLGLDRQVVFCGELLDTRPAYASINVFVLPSAQPEPFGGVVMEAMGHGLPVIGTAIGGTTEQIEDQVTGFWVEPRNPLDLSGKLLALYKDRELCSRMGKAGRQRLMEHFSLEKTVPRLQEIYMDVRKQAGR